MTKQNKVRFPLVLKFWVVLMSLVAACLVIVYLFTIVFLEQYYVADKKNEVQSVTNEAMAQALTHADLGQGGALEDETLYDLAMRHNLCISILRTDGVEVAKYEGVGSVCYVHSDPFYALQMFETALRNRHQMVVNEIKHVQFDTRFFVCCRYFVPDGLKRPTGNEAAYVIMVTAPLASVSEAADAIRDQLIMISVCLMLTATLVSLCLSFWITRPIKKLSLAARTVASGNLDTEVHIASKDELGGFGEDFNHMVGQLRQSDVMQREMIANVSHDLRTPLTMIRGYAESIQDIFGEDKSERDRQLSIIIDETARLNGLVTDMMDLSLLQAGKLKLNHSDFSVVSLCSDALSRFVYLQEKEGFALELTSSLPSGDAVCHADRGRIGQVLYNFIANAAAHSKGTRPDGSPIQRTITLKVVPAGEGFVKISVCDQGEGMEKEDLPRIFDRYYKPYRAAGEQKGTGLGLSIVKAVLQAHGVPFGVTSQKDVGSAFWFELPIASQQKE